MREATGRDWKTRIKTLSLLDVEKPYINKPMKNRDPPQPMIQRWTNDFPRKDKASLVGCRDLVPLKTPWEWLVGLIHDLKNIMDSLEMVPWTFDLEHPSPKKSRLWEAVLPIFLYLLTSTNFNFKTSRHCRMRSD
jgi:hypothetical protein